MKARELINIGFPEGPIIGKMLRACGEASKIGMQRCPFESTASTKRA
jgi:hypothetical protein